MNSLRKSENLSTLQLFTFWGFTQAVHTSSLMLFTHVIKRTYVKVT